MSTVSGSTADTNVKYQRLSTEYVKIRNQVSTLKTALLDEQSKNEDQQNELNTRDIKLRKLISENESLAFRNQQLVKRVEALQSTLDANNASFLMAKNKKKHKEANLRLFGETSRQPPFNAAADPNLVMEQELERKLVENGLLHSRIFDLEKQQEATVSDFTKRLDALEAENGQLKRLIEDRYIIAATTTATSTTYSNAKREANSGDSAEKYRNQPSSSSLSRVNNNNESSNLMCVEDGQEKVETNNGLLIAGEGKLMEHHYAEKIKHLIASLRYATGRAEYYRLECEALVRRSIYELQQKSDLTKKWREAEEKCAALNDSLERTCKNYEAQMRGLYEHMAEQDERIVEQSECINGMRGKRGTDCAESNNNNASNHVGNHGKVRTTENAAQPKENGSSTSSSSLSQNLRKIVGK